MNVAVDRLVKCVESLRQRRYPVMLVVESEKSPLTADGFKATARRCSLQYVDYRATVLAPPDCEIVLGAYMRGHFSEWLLRTAQSAGGLLVRNADEVIASWPDADRKAFFLEFLRTECNDPNDSTRRVPIVLVSRFVGKYVLPRREHGQGLVFERGDCEGGRLNE